MKIFLDTANIDEIKEIREWGVIDGITTNPKIVAQQGGIDFKTRIMEICSMINGPISVEVTTNDLQEMIREAREYAGWRSNIVIKIPMGPVGLKAVKILTSEGIKTNVTACFTVSQVLLAAKAGATYASIFLGRIDDIGYDGVNVIEEAAELFKKHNIKTEIIVGSIRTNMHIHRAALAGAHIITIPYKFFKVMAEHPQTDKTIAEFLEAWKSMRA